MIDKITDYFQTLKIKITPFRFVLVAILSVLLFKYKELKENVRLVIEDTKFFSMDFLEKVFDFLIFLSPFGMLWCVVYLFFRVVNLEKSLEVPNKKIQNIVDEYTSKKDLDSAIETANLKIRKELFEVARLVRVLYIIAEYKDKEVVEGKEDYTTPLSVLSASMDGIDLQSILNDNKITLEGLSKEDKDKKRVFYEIHRGLSILQDQDLRNLIKEEYNKKNPKIK